MVAESVSRSATGAWRRGGVETRRPAGRGGLPPLAGAALLLAPALLLVGLLMLLPTLWLVRLSLFDSGAAGGAARFYLSDTFTWEHYRRALTDSYFHAVAGSTLRLGLLTAVLSVAVAYPLAVWLDRVRGPWGALGAWAVALPKLTNALVLLYGVLLLLGNAGLVNRALLGLGVVRAPLPMFANLFAVLVGEVLLVLPYPVLMLLGVFRAAGRDLEEAAQGLGASPARAFLETTFRLTLPGAVLAFLVTFVWGIGAFAAPLVLGNPSLYTVSVEIHTQTFERADWPLAATLAILQLVAVLLLALLVLLARRLPLPSWTSPLPLPVWDSTRPAAPALLRSLGRLSRWGPAVAHGGALLALACLLAPLLFSILVSLTPTQTIALPSPASGLSLRWYGALLGDPLWRAALAQSLLTAAIATALAVPAATLAAVAVDHLPARLTRLLTLLLLAPLLVPGVVLGLQSLSAFHRLGLWGRPYSVGLAHAMWTLPLAYLMVRAALSAVDRRLEEAARGLGAHPVVAFCLVTLPRLWPALGAAAFLCAVMSINELPMALFLATPSTRTLPTLIWPQLRYNLSPVVAAASSVLLMVTVAGLAAGGLLATRGRSRR